jgi:hypothetical protein
MPPELGEFIEEEDAVVGPRHLARHGYLTPTDQPHIGNGLVGGATRPGGDARDAFTGAAGDARDARGFDGFGQAHRWQEGGKPLSQLRWARPKGPSMGDDGPHVSMEFRCTLWQLPHRDNDPASSEWPRIPRARDVMHVQRHGLRRASQHNRRVVGWRLAEPP